MTTIDGDAEVLDVLRSAGVTAFVERPADWLNRLPLVIVTPLGGTGAGVGEHEHGTYLFECWSPSSRKDARELATGVRAALRSAWLSARLNYADTGALPQPAPSGRDGAWRFDVTCTVGVR